MGLKIEDIKDPALRKRYADAAGITDPSKTGLLTPPVSNEDLARELSKAVFEKPRMNKTETAFYEELLTRGYAKVQFEGITLELGTGARYTPDFYCSYLNDTEDQPNFTTFFEVKGGFIREASLVRLKVAARQFPEFTFILAQKRNGIWSETEVKP